MSGLYAIIGAGPDAAASGEAGLALLDHVPEYESASAQGAGWWLGVCGRPGIVSLAGEQVREGAAKPGDENSGTGSPVAAVAGDILNRTRLAAELGLASTDSPAAVALAAYGRWGEGLFDRFEGAFSLVVHDPEAHVTLAGSDPCCVAQLFAARLGDMVVIASEAKAFMPHPAFRPVLDRQALGELLSFGQALSGRPLFAGVLGLPHGSHFAVRDGGLRVARHWDVRARPRPTLRGAAYTERLHDVISELGAEAFAGEGVLLPLTGGLDSRVFAACAPRDAGAAALTFGAPTDHDCALAARVAAARGIPHRVIALDPGYVGAYAAETVWLVEGRLNPVGNITGSLMDRLRPAPYFISGAGAAAGRHFGRSHMLVPDWAWDHAGDSDFERLFATRVKQYGLPWDRIPELVRGGDELRDAAVRRRLAILAGTRGLPAVDRQDLYIVQERERFGQTGLAIADLWVNVRAPLLTRRWIEAMLAGAPEERIDDRARLRLITGLDPRVAAVPWSLTHLSLPNSARLVTALRAVGMVSRRRLDGAGETADAASVGPPKAGNHALSRIQHRLYRHGDSRDEWLRGPSRALVEDVLLSPRLADHRVFDASAVRRLVQEHMAGASHASALGLILEVELWQRLFEDGDKPPVTRR